MMDRRRFITSSLLAMSALGLRRGAAATIPGSADAMEHDLAIITNSDIAAGVRAAIDAVGGIRRFVSPGSIVFLKPNMSFANPPEWGSTTHPEVIRTVALACLDAGAKRVVAADYPMSRATQCFERSGMTALAAGFRELGFVELKEETQFDTVALPEGQEVHELKIAKIARKADVFINLPALKAHSATSVSFGLKNLMGLFWDRSRFHRDFDLHNAIVDLAGVLHPHLTLLTGPMALVTNGPMGPGRVEPLNTFIAGVNPVAVDAAGCGVATWNNRATSPESVQHLARAAERGLGPIDLSTLSIFRG